MPSYARKAVEYQQKRDIETGRAKHVTIKTDAYGNPKVVSEEDASGKPVTPASQKIAQDKAKTPQELAATTRIGNVQMILSKQEALRYKEMGKAPGVTTVAGITETPGGKTSISYVTAPKGAIVNPGRVNEMAATKAYEELRKEKAAEAKLQSIEKSHVVPALKATGWKVQERGDYYRITRGGTRKWISKDGTVIKDGDVRYDPIIFGEEGVKNQKFSTFRPEFFGNIAPKPKQIVQTPMYLGKSAGVIEKWVGWEAKFKALPPIKYQQEGVERVYKAAELIIPGQSIPSRISRGLIMIPMGGHFLTAKLFTRDIPLAASGLGKIGYSLAVDKSYRNIFFKKQPEAIGAAGTAIKENWPEAVGSAIGIAGTRSISKVAKRPLIVEKMSSKISVLKSKLQTGYLAIRQKIIKVKTEQTQVTGMTFKGDKEAYTKEYTIQRVPTDSQVFKSPVAVTGALKSKTGWGELIEKLTFGLKKAKIEKTKVTGAILSQKKETYVLRSPKQTVTLTLVSPKQVRVKSGIKAKLISKAKYIAGIKKAEPYYLARIYQRGRLWNKNKMYLMGERKIPLTPKMKFILEGKTIPQKDVNSEIIVGKTMEEGPKGRPAEPLSVKEIMNLNSIRPWMLSLKERSRINIARRAKGKQPLSKKEIRSINNATILSLKRRLEPTQPYQTTSRLKPFVEFLINPKTPYTYKMFTGAKWDVIQGITKGEALKGIRAYQKTIVYTKYKQLDSATLGMKTTKYLPSKAQEMQQLYPKIVHVRFPTYESRIATLSTGPFKKTSRMDYREPPSLVSRGAGETAYSSRIRLFKTESLFPTIIGKKAQKSIGKTKQAIIQAKAPIVTHAPRAAVRMRVGSIIKGSQISTKSRVFAIPDTKTRTETKSGIKTETRSRLRTETRSDIKSILRTETRSDIKTETKSEVLSRVKSAVKMDTILKQETKVDTKVDTKIDTPSDKPETKIDVSPPIDVPFFEFRVKPNFEKKKRKFFRTKVRRKRKFGSIGIFETEKSAFSAGMKNIFSTAAASFKVEEERGNLIMPSFKDSRLYQSRREPGVFIQKRRFRISSPGEKREITFKGLSKLRFMRGGL